MTRSLALLALLLVAAPARADLLYTYEGGLFQMVSGAYTPTDRVTGSLRLDDAFQPQAVSGRQYVPASAILDYRFSDGHQTMTPENSSAMYWDRPGIALPFAGDGTPLDPGRRGYQLTFVAADGSIDISYFTDYYDRVVTGPARWTFPDGTVSGVTAEYCSWECNYYAGLVGGPIPRWTVETVGVPERAILPKLPRLLKVGPGLGLEAAVTRRLQVVTAWAAAALLGARRDGVFIEMPRVRLEVQEACSGLQTLLVMLLVAGLIGMVKVARWSSDMAGAVPRDRVRGPVGVSLARFAPRTSEPLRMLALFVVLICSAIILALEANALRVAGIAVALEHLGSISTLGKDWIQYGTTGLALGQLVGLAKSCTAVYGCPTERRP